MDGLIDERPKTWHYGLIARWWAEFNTATPEELAYYQAAIETYGQPALDLACGAGRLLVPLAAQGLDVEGVDLSPDMLAQAAALARTKVLTPNLHTSALHEMNLPRRYRTIYCCDSFGVGGQRGQDELAMSRVYEHLVPGGAFVFNHYLPITKSTRIAGPIGCPDIDARARPRGPFREIDGHSRTAMRSS